MKNQMATDAPLAYVPTETAYVPAETRYEVEPKRSNRRPLCLCCCIFCILILVAIALVIYFFYPRYPTATVQQDQINIKQWTWNATSNSVEMDITVPIIIYNPNRYFLKLSFPAAPIYYARTGQYIGTTKPTPLTKFPKKANTTIVFDILMATGANSSAFATSLAQDCGTPADPSKSVTMNIKAHVYVWIVRNYINIPITQNANIPCTSASDAAAAGGSIPSNIPSGVLPPGVTLPPNVTIPPNVAIGQQHN